MNRFQRLFQSQPLIPTTQDGEGRQPNMNQQPWSLKAVTPYLPAGRTRQAGEGPPTSSM